MRFWKTDTREHRDPKPNYNWEKLQLSTSNPFPPPWASVLKPRWHPLLTKTLRAVPCSRFLTNFWALVGPCPSAGSPQIPVRWGLASRMSSGKSLTFLMCQVKLLFSLLFWLKYVSNCFTNKRESSREYGDTGFTPWKCWANAESCLLPDC